jgi:hypothetical protein
MKSPIGADQRPDSRKKAASPYTEDAGKPAFSGRFIENPMVFSVYGQILSL